MRLLITRPEPDASALAGQLVALGHQVLKAPLMVVEPRDFDFDPAGVRAVLFTSANGVRAFARAVGMPPDLPAFVVGAASGDAAKVSGWRQVEVAGGDVRQLADLASDMLSPEGGRLVHVSGKAATGDLAGDLSSRGYDVVRVVGYEAREVDALPGPVEDALQAGEVDGILLFSPRTARLFAKRVLTAGLQEAVSGVVAYCLSPAVAEALKSQISVDCKVATQPETPHLIALLSP